MKHDEKKPVGLLLPRRTLIRGVGIALAMAPFAQLLACGGGTDDGSGTDDGGGKGNGTWATGGTAAMSGNYPDPFASGIGSACTVYKAATLGPCYAATVDRKDISEAQPGLPVRLAFLIVNPSCQPVPGATVDVWHTNPAGLYSGSDASNMCTNGNAAARASRWFRGIRATDANGRVDFDTCFPGWYSSRTIHIHFTVRVGGTEYLTSQLFFEDALNNEIISTQTLYSSRGAKDTTNVNDNVLRQSGLTDYYFQTQKMDDGALLAWKTIVVHA
ncbi:protocatechuate 3,4-dioxygenase, partial [Hyalangium minutum]|uniref:dioxygenase family protein n=1 Tax=Hyalangium minutum TaxID=394096 RepID=UPI0005C719B6